jgi:hypothetical protein
MRRDIPLLPQARPQQSPGEGLAQLIKNTIGDAVLSALNEQRDQAISERAAAQRALDAAPPGSDRSVLTGRLDRAKAKVDKLTADLAKAESKLATPTTAPTAPTAPTLPTPATPITFPGGTDFPQGPFSGNDQVPTTMIISVVGLVFVGFPLALAFARLLWKRGNRVADAPPSQLPADSTRRFDQLEHAVDAIAIEVERISENQRYLTNLLSEPRPNVAVGSGRGGLAPAS